MTALSLLPPAGSDIFMEQGKIEIRRVLDALQKESEVIPFQLDSYETAEPEFLRLLTSYLGAAYSASEIRKR